MASNFPGDDDQTLPIYVLAPDVVYRRGMETDALLPSANIPATVGAPTRLPSTPELRYTTECAEIPTHKEWNVIQRTTLRRWRRWRLRRRRGRRGRS
ncbi:hypothetical protein LINGRAPRIM_LOCUS3210 [Linum grandiflorum]